jgi:Zn finger protein HypA/HybF involved in hydrogenase expression
MTATPLHRTLDQELQALVRGISLECLVCGEFVLRTARQVSCPECGTHVRSAVDSAGAGCVVELPAG